MASVNPVQHLTIFLVKSAYATPNQIVNLEECDHPITVPIAGYGSGQLHIKRTPPTAPKWAKLFKETVDLNSLKIPGISAIFLINVNGRYFVLSFGQGGRFLIRENTTEDRFGLLCTLNSIDPKSLRCVDVQSLDAIQSHTRIQSGQATSSDQFGLDVEQDMLKAVVGAPLDEAFGTRMAGSDALSVSVKMNLLDLPYLLDEYRKKFEADLSAKDHQWVNNISLTKDATTIASLETELNRKLAAKIYDNIWLSIPEIINWQTVKGFMYSHGRKEVHSDISFPGFLKTINAGSTITLDLLRQRKVHCADADHNPVYNSWPVFRCLYAEIDLPATKHILNDGKWYTVATDFVTKTNSDFDAMPMSNLMLPDYTGGGEGAYNEGIATVAPNQYALLDDKKKIMHGGGHGQVEICDLLSIDRELIHVKMYGRSNVFSHLFAQGFVSGQLIQIDPEFRQKVRAQLTTPFVDLIQVETKPAQDDFTIVYAVISDADGSKLRLPFFSRVNLNNTARILRGFGYKVELLKIGVDPVFAKTALCPPKKSKKRKAKPSQR